eukprot:Rhum_TRINITY_DN13396_c0_g2::Rhum_TRINITY_DN13396_c0_g2_i1::g.59743::m.59743
MRRSRALLLGAAACALLLLVFVLPDVSNPTAAVAPPVPTAAAAAAAEDADSEKGVGAEEAAGLRVHPSALPAAATHDDGAEAAREGGGDGGDGERPVPTVPPALGYCARSLAVRTRRLLCFGDSLTAGAYFEASGRLAYHPYGAELARLLGGGWTVEARGYPGWKVGDLEAHLPSLAAQKFSHKEYDGVVVLSGANDLMLSTASAEAVAAASLRLAEAVRRHVRVGWVVHLKNPLLVPSRRSRARKLQKLQFYCQNAAKTNSRLRAANRALQRMLGGGAGCRLLDPFDALSMARNLSRVWADCLHPTPAGSDMLARHIAERLTPMLYPAPH